MKKIIISALVLVLLVGCSDRVVNNERLPEVTDDIKQTPIIVSEGSTLQTRINTPVGFMRTEKSEDSFGGFVRNYKMKDHGSKVFLYNGSEKRNQNAHAAVFDMPLVEGDLQQCADSVMRMYAEYYFETEQYEKIAFHFTDGFLCEYNKWRDGYRVGFENGKTVWKKTSSYDMSYDCFEKYLRMVFSYAGTASMERYESKTAILSELDIGDVILKGGSPGHVVMVADVCVNEQGENAFLLAQGYMPAQEFHILNNPLHTDDPWYYESEMEFPLKTPEYVFDDINTIKKLSYKG